MFGPPTDLPQSSDALVRTPVEFPPADMIFSVMARPKPSVRSDHGQGNI